MQGGPNDNEAKPEQGDEVSKAGDSLELREPGVSLDSSGASGVVTPRKYNSPIRSLKIDASVKWICETCGAIFPNKRRRLRHLQVHHPETWKGTMVRLQCLADGCDRTFTSSIARSEHVYRFHPRLERPKCDLCGGLEFKDQRGLTKHRLTQHLANMPDGTSLCCTVKECKKVCKNYSCLRRHMLSHRDPAELPSGFYRCGVVGCSELPYSSYQALVRHRKQAHEGFNYKCPYCMNKGYVSMARFRDHLQKLHGSQIVESLYKRVRETKEATPLEATPSGATSLEATPVTGCASEPAQPLPGRRLRHIGVDQPGGGISTSCCTPSVCSETAASRLDPGQVTPEKLPKTNPLTESNITDFGLATFLDSFINDNEAFTKLIAECPDEPRLDSNTVFLCPIRRCQRTFSTDSNRRSHFIRCHLRLKVYLCRACSSESPVVKAWDMSLDTDRIIQPNSPGPNQHPICDSSEHPSPSADLARIMKPELASSPHPGVNHTFPHTPPAVPNLADALKSDNASLHPVSTGRFDPAIPPDELQDGNDSCAETVPSIDNASEIDCHHNAVVEYCPTASVPDTSTVPVSKCNSAILLSNRSSSSRQQAVESNDDSSGSVKNSRQLYYPLKQNHEETEAPKFDLNAGHQHLDTVPGSKPCDVVRKHKHLAPGDSPVDSFSPSSSSKPATPVQSFRTTPTHCFATFRTCLRHVQNIHSHLEEPEESVLPFFPYAPLISNDVHISAVYRGFQSGLLTLKHLRDEGFGGLRMDDPSTLDAVRVSLDSPEPSRRSPHHLTI